MAVTTNPLITGVPKPNYFGFENKIFVTIDFASATWNTVATHEVFNVTGAIRAAFVYMVTESLTSGGAATLSFGRQGATAEYSAAQTYSNFAAGNFVFRGGTAAPRMHSTAVFSELAADSTFSDQLLYDLDVGYQVNSAALTNGTIEAVCFWTPLSQDGLVVAGAGGTL